MHEPGVVPYGQLCGEHPCLSSSLLGFTGQAFRRETELLKGLWFSLGNAVPLRTLLLSAAKKKKNQWLLTCVLPSSLGLTRKKLFQRTRYKGCIQTMSVLTFIHPVHSISAKNMLQQDVSQGNCFHS